MSGSMDSAQSSHQLDFYQAMTDFKLMFPNMDEEVIEAVLRANGGAVDGTIDQLLTMNTDFDQPAVAGGSTSAGSRPPFSARVKRILELGGRDRQLLTSETSGSSYGDDSASKFSRSSFVRPFGSKSSFQSSLDSETGRRCSRKTDSCGISSLSGNMSEELLLLETTDDSQVFSGSIDVCDGAVGGDGCTPSQGSWDESNFLPAAPAPPIPPRSPLLVAPPLPPKMSLVSPVVANSFRGANVSPISRDSRKKARSWDPPLLGKLPDDFLRLDIGPTTTHKAPKVPSTAAVPCALTHSMQDTATRSRNSCQETSPLPSARIQPLQLSSDTGHKRGHSTGNHHSHSHRSSDDGMMSLTHSCECKRHSSSALERPSNSRRHIEIDANTWQMLEDERLALVLQSEEFLTELRQNEDFMRSLEHERQSRNSGDAQTVAPALDKSAHTEDSAEFRTLLKHVGDSSRKKLIAAAHRFFAKCKRKSQKPILKDSAAPSTVNLLDEEETNCKDIVDEDMPFTDEQYKWWSQH